ncbi:MAG: matrixin family metalloprotease [Bdellovibrionaceae bacterium]|nr:matrixin family metalloprotease [Pseudobdellovibrionaceae bacterium]MBX3034251.1 matrixin family metalloprotease [Pseudobdellovibrionaceae bacterium]
MRKWFGLLAGCAALLSLQACAPKAQDDCGFVQNVYGERISWKGQIPITLQLHESVPDQYVEAIKAAANSWNKASGKPLFRIDETKATGTPTGRDRQNLISFSSNWEQEKLSEQAKTSVHWVGDQIQEADIRVNASKTSSGREVFQFYWQDPNATTVSGGGVNIEALLLHELGHVLGLKHKDRDSSVMATYLASNSDRTELAETDKSSLQCEY